MFSPAEPQVVRHGDTTVSCDHEMAVAREARCCLMNSGYRQLGKVSCSYMHHGEVLTLRGRVPTFYLKQVAQSSVAKIDQVRHVVNLLEVTGSNGRETDGHPSHVPPVSGQRKR